MIKVSGIKISNSFKLLVIILNFALLTLNPYSALAQSSCAEVPLPLIGTGDIDPCSSPAAYIAYWFYFSLYLAGIFALLVFVIGGVLYMTSGVMGTTQKATKMMQDAALGMILLFGSYLFLHTFNPALTIIQNPPPFGLLQACSANFVPQSLAKLPGKTDFFWSLADKDIEPGKISLVCKDEKGNKVLENNSGSLKAIDTIKDMPIASQVTCTVTGANKNNAKIDGCSATIITPSALCSLDQVGNTLSWALSDPTNIASGTRVEISCDFAIFPQIIGSSRTSAALPYQSGGGSEKIDSKNVPPAGTVCKLSLKTKESGDSFGPKCQTTVRQYIPSQFTPTL